MSAERAPFFQNVLLSAEMLNMLNMLESGFEKCASFCRDVEYVEYVEYVESFWALLATGKMDF